MKASGPRHDATITLSVRDRKLIQFYGYPVSRLNSDLAALGVIERSRSVAIDPLELDLVIGGLSSLTSECAEDAFKHELKDLCKRLESAEHRSRWSNR